MTSEHEERLAMRRSRILAVCLVWTCAFACASERTTPGDTSQDVADPGEGDAGEAGGGAPTYGFCEGPIVAVFDPDDGLALPFPSDLFSAEDAATPTGLRVHFTQANSSADPMFQDYPGLRAQLNELDGFGTTAGLVFALSDEIGARETQGAETTTTAPPILDNVALTELASELSVTDFLPPGAPDGLPEIEASPLYLTGHSLGASIGAAVAALSPRVAIANLCAGGGGVLNILLRGQVFNLFVIALKPEGTTDADLHRFFPLLQTLIERGDPANYARLVAREPLTGLGCAATHVLFQEVEGDTYVPNITNELLSRGLGLAHVRPVEHEVFGLPQLDEPMAMNHANGVTAGFFQFAWQNGGAEPAIHTHIFADEVAQAQWIHFFSTYRASGHPEVIDPYRALGIRASMGSRAIP
jgi:hypothetical protein